MPQWENGVQFPSEKPNWYHSTWHSQADFTQIIALGLTPEPSMKRFSLVLSFYMGGDLQLKEVKYQQSKPQSVAETGFNAGPPVHISTLSHSLYLTHALDFPYSLCPRSGTNPWDNGLSKCRSQLEIQNKTRDSKHSSCVSPSPKPQLHMFSNSVCSQSSTVNRTANQSQDNALIHV